MAGITNEAPAALIHEINLVLDEIYQLAGDLGQGITPNGEYKLQPIVEDSEFHRKTAKMALAQVRIRDLVEATTNSVEAKVREPLNLSVTMSRLVNIYCLLNKVDEARYYFDSLKTLIHIPSSNWQIGESINILVIGYQASDQPKKASDLYYKYLKYSHYEEMSHGLVRAAFNIISWHIVNGELDQAYKIYKTMESYCQPKTELTLVVKNASENEDDNLSDIAELEPLTPLADEPKPIDENNNRPNLTLVNSQAKTKNTYSDNEPLIAFDGDEYERPCLIRMQAAVNILSSYAYVRIPHKAIEIYNSITETDDIEEYIKHKCMAAVNLIRTLILSKHWDEAFHYYREILHLNQKNDNSLLVAKAAVELIGFADKNRIPEAEFIYKSLNGLNNNPEIILEQSRAAGNLIYIYGDYNQIDKARALYDTLDVFGNSLEILVVKAKTTVNLLTDYCNNKMFDKAEELFNYLLTISDDPCFDPSKIQAAHNLMSGYFNNNDYNKAEALFWSLSKFNNSPQALRHRARAVFSLVSFYIHKTDLEKSLFFYNNFDELGDSKEVLLEKGRALVNLVSFIGGIGLTSMAKKFYTEFYTTALPIITLEAEYIEDNDNDGDDLELFDEMNTPIGGFSEEIIDNVFYETDNDETFFTSEETDEDNLSTVLGKSAFNLVLDYVDSGNFQEAENIYLPLFNLDLSNNILAYDVVQAGLILITAAASLGRWPLVMRIFDAFKSLPNNHTINHQRCLAALNILNCNIPRLPHISKAVYEFLKDVQPRGLFSNFIARSALDMINCLIDEKKYLEAIKIYHSMADLGKNHRILEKRAQAASSLMKVYSSLGWLAEAKKLYQSISGLGNSPKVLKHRLKSAKLLSKLMRSSGLHEAAEQLQTETNGFTKFSNTLINNQKLKHPKAKKTSDITFDNNFLKD
jgi:hypothetical protein